MRGSVVPTTWRAMRAVPKCTVKLTEYLEDLRKVEDIELLRQALKEHRLFPKGANPDKAP